MGRFVTLELNLRRAEGGGYSLDLRFSSPHSAAEERLKISAPIQFNFNFLRANELNHLVYGQHLTSALFADPNVLAYLARAEEAAGDSFLRVRLLIDGDASELHRLRWETLRHPQTDAALCMNERLLFSRYLTSANWRPVRSRPKGTLRALAVVADPTEAAEELRRARESLRDLPLTELPSQAEGRVTMGALLNRLRETPDILYLACHGLLKDGEPYLLLEDDANQKPRISGADFAVRLGELRQLPRLIVLAVCGSAMRGEGEALAAVGPRLAEAGVPAVLAMLGDVSMETVERFMPVFFGELERDGQIDRALAAARGAIRGRDDWWMPVLFTRLSDGRLWPEPEAFTSLFNALHQLPSPPADFTGREAELKELQDAVQTGDASISGVRGLGGVGKTALALKLAEVLQDRYPDAQFFLDLKGVSEQPLTPAEALAHVIRAYHPLEKLPEGEAELLSLYRSVLHGKRALLVLDNAKDRAQIEPLLPPATCYLLVTSRQKFALPGLRPLDLDALPAADARALLLKIAARIGEHCVEMAGLCGNLPLALRLAASALAERIDLTPEDYLRRLRKAQTQLELIDASLSLSYDLLTPDSQSRWRRLAVFPESFDRAGTQAVWAMEGEDAVQDALSELVRYSLLEYNIETGRYKLHDLARVFANSRLSDAELTVVQRRHAVHYVDLVVAADALYQQNSENMLLGLNLIEMEWLNIRVSLNWATQAGEVNLAQTLCSCLCTFWQTRGYLSEGRYWLTQILALESSPTVARANVLNAAGNIAWSSGDYTAARTWHEMCLDLRRKLGNKSTIASSLHNLGIATMYQGDYDTAQKFHTESLAIKRQLNNVFGIANSLNELGILATARNDLTSGLSYHNESLALRRTLGDMDGVAISLVNLSALALQQGYLEVAQEQCLESLTLFRMIGDKDGIVASLLAQGRIAKALGNTTQSAQCFQKALHLCLAVGNRGRYALCLEELASLALRSGELNRATRLFASATIISEKIAFLPPPQLRYYSLENDLATLRSQMGEAEFLHEWDVGRALSEEQSIEYALESSL